jgi:hypothetical protein
MCHVLQGGAALEDFLFGAGEGYLRATSWRWGSPSCGSFDCRRGGTGGEDAPWTELQYGNVMKQVKRWMEGIHRWNVIFLLPAGLFFEESMRTSFGIRAECTLLRGVWIFGTETVEAYSQDLRYDG